MFGRVVWPRLDNLQGEYDYDQIRAAIWTFRDLDNWNRQIKTDNRVGSRAIRIRLTCMRQRNHEEQQRRDRVIAEFGGDPQAMADEVLRLRHGMAQLGRAIDWLKRGAPCIVIPPGPHWKPSWRRPMPTPNLSEDERARRCEFVRNARGAAIRREPLEARTKRREKYADEWAQWWHRRMDATGCDAVELLPDAFARLQECADDAVVAALRELKKSLMGVLK
jgi:hypothetical protein